MAQHVLGKKIGLLSHSFPTRHQIYVYTLYFSWFLDVIFIFQGKQKRLVSCNKNFPCLLLHLHYKLGTKMNVIERLISIMKCITKKEAIFWNSNYCGTFFDPCLRNVFTTYTQCWNWRIFPLLRFCVKSKLASESHNLPFWHI